MALDTQLFDMCKSLNLNCSLTYQRINDFSVEIYYQSINKPSSSIFYTDGHIKKSEAIKDALKWLKKQYPKQEHN